MRKAILLLIATLAAGGAALAGPKQAGPIKVFVFTTTANEAGFVDTDLKQRSDSVKDLLRSLGKKPIIQIVSDRDGADVTLEVLGRGAEAVGSTTGGRDALGQWRTYQDTVVAVRVHLIAGNYSTDFDGRSAYPHRVFGAWGEAASNAARAIEHWIKANHDNLIAKRAAPVVSASK